MSYFEQYDKVAPEADAAEPQNNTRRIRIPATPEGYELFDEVVKSVYGEDGLVVEPKDANFMLFLKTKNNQAQGNIQVWRSTRRHGGNYHSGVLTGECMGIPWADDGPVDGFATE